MNRNSVTSLGENINIVFNHLCKLHETIVQILFAVTHKQHNYFNLCSFVGKALPSNGDTNATAQLADWAQTFMKFC